MNLVFRNGSLRRVVTLSYSPQKEDEVERCPSCESVFHKPCFRKLISCPCAELLRTNETLGITKKLTRGTTGDACLRCLGLSGKGIKFWVECWLYSLGKAREAERA